MSYKLMLSIILVVVILALFAKTANHQFINFDDTGYVTTNPVVKGGLTASGIAWAFTTTAMSNWHPLTWLSHMADVQMFGLNPRGHHLTSVFMHAAAALLLFLLLDRITGALWRSFSVAALFALHPLHVESVAWVAERKDVLSCLFMLLSLHCYAVYVKKPGYRPYLCSLLAFVAGLMTKPMLVTLPLVMLLLDYWPFNRFSRDEAAEETGSTSGGEPLFFALIREKIPFFLFSAFSAAITIYVQHKGGAMATLVKVPVVLRITNAFIAYVKYIGLMFWPYDLAILYPFPRWLSYSQAMASCILLLFISAAAVCFRRRYPYLVTGWFWYLVTLLPVIGLIQVGGQSMADRYTYIPLTGLFIACCWLVSDLTQGWRWRRAILGGVGCLAILVLTAVTWHQLDYWNDSISICRHTLSVTSDNYLITNNYGIALDERGDHAGAYRLYQETLQIFPGSATAYSNLGSICVRWGKFEEAIGYYEKALALAPDHAIARAGMGSALASLGRSAEAIAMYEQALKIDPMRSESHLDLALELMKTGRRAEAMQHYKAAQRLDPISPKASINMGVMLAKEGKMEEALDVFSRAITIDPESVEAHFNRGVALAKLNRIDEAANEFNRVLAITPDAVAARRWLDSLGRK